MHEHKIWVIADTHFGHESPYSRWIEDGKPYRPHGSAEQADIEMVESWNEVVHEQDIIYHLGDVSWDMKSEYNRKLLLSLKGRKMLVGGNHDHNLKYYAPFFQKIYAVKPMENCVLTHIPIHPDCVERWGINVHGHLHKRVVKDFRGRVDHRYICASVEQTAYKPILLEQLLETVRLNKIVSLQRFEECPECKQMSVRARELREGGGVECTSINCGYWFCF